MMNASHSNLMMLKIEEKRQELVLSIQNEGIHSANSLLKSQELDQLIYEWQRENIYEH